MEQAWGRDAQMTTGEVRATTHAGQRLRVQVAWLLLAGIVVGALALRLWAISWQLPFTVNVDEPVVVDQASGIVLTGDLNPHRFVYPSLQIYLQAAISWLHLQWGVANGLYHGVADLPANSHIITTAPGFYVWGRAGTAVLGALTVLFTGLAGRWLGGWRVGIVAALLLAVSPLHVGHSRTVTPDVPASCFTALALLGAVAVLRQPVSLSPWRRAGLYALAGAAFGLATATKYNAVVIGACLLLAHLLARPPRAWLASADLWVAGVASVVAFFLATPFALLDRSTFLNDVASIIVHYKTGHEGYESDQNWWWYLQWLLRNETWLIVPALAGIIWAAMRQRRRDLVLLSFVLLSYAGLASYRVHFARNLLPLFPFFALLAAQFVADLASLAARWRPRLAGVMLPAMLSVGLLLALAPARQSADIAAHFARPDSRVAAINWLRAHTVPEERVLADVPPRLIMHDLRLDSTDLVGALHASPLEWLIWRGYRYVVVDKDTFGKFQRSPERYPREAAAYAHLFARATEVARFEEEAGYPGPEVRVLRLPDASTAEPLMSQRLQKRLGPIELMGVNLAPVPSLDNVAIAGHSAPKVAPGGILGLTLFWRTTTALTTDYTIFVHVLDSQGRKVAQRDTPPLGGELPTSSWYVAQIVVDPANVPLPAELAPGTYRVVVGLYEPTTGKRLPLQLGTTDQADSIEVGTVQVKR